MSKESENNKMKEECVFSQGVRENMLRPIIKDRTWLFWPLMWPNDFTMLNP